MRQDFAASVMRAEMARGSFTSADSFVAVCAGQGDQALFESLGLARSTLTNIDIEQGSVLGHAGDVAPSTVAADAHWEKADVHALPFEDDAFDVAFVSDGLHHCRSPHLAVTEMFRVARRAVVVVESRDSAVMRGAIAAGLTWRYEFNARLLQGREHGGVDFGPVPNFVYRWTEREFEKLLATYDPAHDHDFAYYHGLNLPKRLQGNVAVRAVGAGVMRALPRQGNTFALVAVKGPLKSYLAPGVDGGPRLRDTVRGPRAQRDGARRTTARHHLVKTP